MKTCDFIVKIPTDFKEFVKKWSMLSECIMRRGALSPWADEASSGGAEAPSHREAFNARFTSLCDTLTRDRFDCDDPSVDDVSSRAVLWFCDDYTQSFD